MADSKISQLTSATTPLAGTEVLPIVQSGATKQVSIDNLTAGRNFSAGTITANIIVPTVAEFPDGTAAAPSITNTGDLDTGMYFPAANAVSFVTAGVNRLRINSSGDVGIGTITPGARLDVRGSATFNEDGANVDFRVEGDTDANLFFVDASADFVGIGTNAPTQKLTVAGSTTTVQGNTITSNNLAGNAFSLVSNSDATAGSSSSVLLWNNNGLSASSAALSFFSSSSSVPDELRLSNGAAAPITFYTNGSERVRINSSGNVGVGTANPLTILSAYNTTNAFVSSQSTTGYAGLQATNTSGTIYFGIDNSTAGGFSAGNYSRVIWSSGAYPLVLATNGNERMRITDTGNVGIGTSTPTSKLDVNGTITATGFSISTLTVTGNTYLATSTGNVGVGTTSPVNTAGYVGLTINGPSGSILSMMQNGSETFRITNATGSSFINTTGATPLLLGTAATERMRITATGDVGIGTTTPTSKLDVNGTITATGFSVSTLTVTGNTYLATTSGSVGVGTAAVSGWQSALKSVEFPNSAFVTGQSNVPALYTGVNTYNDGDWRYKTSDVATYYQQYNGVHSWYVAPSGTAGNVVTFSQVMTILASGNVGIGTTTPDSKLHVASETNIARLRIGFNNTSFNYYDADTQVFRSGDATERMRLDSVGDLIVGGTTTNSVRFTAEKNNPTRGILANLSNSGSTGLTGSQLMFTQNTVNNWVIGQPAGVDAFAFWRGRNTAADGTEFMRVDSSGNLLVGTTTSISKLTVAGNAFIGNNTAGSATVLVSNSDATAASNSGLLLWNDNGFSSTAGSLAFFSSTSSVPNELRMANGGAAPITFYTNGSERVRIDSSGNLLVGTTTPELGAGFGNIQVQGSSGALVQAQYGTTVKTDIAADAAGGYVGTRSNHSLFVITNNTERMRVNTSGDVGIGTTVISGRLNVATSGDGTQIRTSDGTISAKVSSIVSSVFYTGVTSNSPWAVLTNDVERMRVTSAGDVGIGTSSPANKLHVSGTGSTPTLFERTGANGVYLQLKDVSGASVFLGADNGLFAVQTPGSSYSNKLVVDSSGNVGIGTSSPGNKLHIVGSGDILRFTNGSVSLYGYSDSAGLGWFTGAAGTNTGVYYNNTSSYQSFYTGSIERMRLDSAGSLGLGTASPVGKFGVAGSQTVGFNAGLTGSPEAGNLFYTTDGTGWQFRIGKYQSGAFTSQMVFTDAGNVGVGTTSPTAKLDIVGSGATAARLKGGSGTNQGAAFYIEQAGSTNTLFAIGDSAAILGGTPDTAVNIYTAGSVPLTMAVGGTEKVRITSAGDVGIGTSSPRSLLDLNATRQVKVYFGTAGTIGETQETASDYTANNLFVSGESGGTMTYTKTTNDSGNAILQDYSRGITFYSGVTGNTSTTGTLNNFERMRLDTAGNLGLGVTPTSKLQINTTAASTASITTVTSFGAAGVVSLGKITNNSEGVYLGSGTVETGVNGGIAAGIGFLREASNWNSALAFYTNNVTDGVTTNRITERMRITSAGDVGIGTASPSQKLTVSGGNLFVSNNTAGSATALVSNSDATAGSNAGLLLWNNNGFSATAGSLYFYSSTSSVPNELRLANGGAAPITLYTNGSERVRITSAGDVGIGTATPAVKLDVANGFVIVGANTANPGVGGNVRFRDDTGASRWLNGILGSVGATAYSIYDIVAGAERLTINSTGDVGIGTSSPAYKLDVLIGAGSGNLFRAGQSGVSNGYTITSNGSALTHFWATTGEAMRLDTSGNLGLGVTPSAASLPTIQSAYGLFTGNVEAHISKNAYYNSGWKYAITAPAARYSVGEGDSGYRWYQAGSGTAGNAISFTQAMTLDASGNLLVGGTSPVLSAANRGNITITGSASSIVSVGTSASAYTCLYHDASGGDVWNNQNTYLRFGTNNTERMRITSAGYVGIGTASPATKLEVYGTHSDTTARLYSTGDGGTQNASLDMWASEPGWTYSGSGLGGNVNGHPYYGRRNTNYGQSIIRFDNGNTYFHNSATVVSQTPQAIIDSSGNLGVGTSSPSSYGVIVAKKDQTADTAISVGNQGTVNAATSMSFTLNEAGTPQGWLRRYRDGTGNTEVGFSDALLFTGSVTGTKTERARITSGGDLLVGTTSTSALTAFSGSAVGQVIQSGVPVLALVDSDDTTNGVVWLANSSGVGYLYTKAANPFVFGTNGVEKMRLDSTGRLLVGTTTTGPQLPSGSIQYATTSHIASGGFGRFWVPSQQIGSATYAGLYGLATTYNAYYSGGWKSIGGGTASAITIDEGIFAFSNTNSVGAADQALTWTNRLVIDTSGNLGLGVTPSAWKSDQRALQIGASGSLVSNTSANNLLSSSNAYFDAGAVYRYIANDFATQYEQYLGKHAWYTAPSGTAGNAIGFTQAMTLDASGNLSIGQASSALQSGGTGITLYGSSASEIKFLNSTTGSSATDGTALVTSGSDFVINNRESGAVTFGTSNTERARITSSGDLLVGTTTSLGKLTVSGGNVFVGNNTAGGATALVSNSDATAGSTAGVLLWNDNGFSATAGSLYFYSSTSTVANELRLANGGNAPITMYTNGSERVRIKGDGEVQIAGTTDRGAYNLQCNGTGVWGAGAYVNGSDERLKDNIQTLTDGLSIVTQLRPVTYQYKPEYSKDQSIQPGFIAQELQQAMEGKAYVEGVVQAGPEYLNVAYQNLIPILTKAIQELKAEVDALKAQLNRP